MKHLTTRFAPAILMLSLAGAACPGGGDEHDDGSVVPRDAALDAGFDDGGNRTVTVEIGPEGGTLASESGVVIEIPSGALSTPTEIGITTGAGGLPEVPWTSPTRGEIYELTPHGITFEQPVTLRFPHGGGATAALALLTLPQGGIEWSDVVGARVEGVHVVAEVTGFSWFVIGDGVIRWWRPGSISSASCIVDVTSGSALFSATDGTSVWSSLDGDIWSDATDNLASVGALDVSRLALVHGDLFAGSRRGLYRASTGWPPWESVNSGLPTDTYGNPMSVGAIGVLSEGLLVAVNGDQFSTGGVFFSADQGATWQPRYDGLDPYASFRSFAEHGAWYLGVLGDGLWYSTDLGYNWNPRDTADPDYGAFTDAYDLTSAFGGLFACTEKGIYRSLGFLQPFEMRDAFNTPRPLGNYNPCNVIRPFSDYLVVGYTAMGIRASRDQGETWTSANIGMARRGVDQVGYLTVGALTSLGDTAVAGLVCGGVQTSIVTGP